MIKVVFPIVNAIPVDYANGEDYQDPADDRMVKPPRFPYDGPYGFYSSGILCIFDQTPYIGGWFGRSCAGPIAPFMQPTPPSTEATTTTTTTPAPPTTQPVNLMQQQMQWWQMMMQGNGWGSPYQSYLAQAAETDPYEDYGDPVRYFSKKKTFEMCFVIFSLF